MDLIKHSNDWHCGTLKIKIKGKQNWIGTKSNSTYVISHSKPNRSVNWKR